MAPPPLPDVDLLFGGTLRLAQPPRGIGYRANVDAFLVSRAALLEVGRARHALDLGAGVGALGLSYALFAACPVTLLERDPGAAALARHNASAIPGARVIEGDVEHVRVRADLVLCNPPFTEPTAGRPSPDPARDAARRGRVAPFLRAAAGSLETAAGRAFFVYPSEHLPALLQAAAREGLSAASLRFVHPRAGAPARVAIAAFAARPAGPTLVHPPWFEWDGSSREAGLAAFLAGVGDLTPPAARGP